MTSLARRTRARKLAQKLAAATGNGPATGIAPDMPETGEAVSEYNILLTVLHNDLREIRDIQSVEARNPVKAQKAATYADWVKGALAAGAEGKAVQDEIVVTQMIWAMDYGDYDYALEIAEHCLTHGLNLPEQYKRTMGCMIAEEIAEDALAARGAVSTPILLRTHALTEKADMPDQARAKLLKALGRAFAEDATNFDPEADNAVAGGKTALTAAAVSCLSEALKLNKKVGVKKELDALKKQLADLGGPPPAQPSSSDDGAKDEGADEPDDDAKE